MNRKIGKNREKELISIKVLFPRENLIPNGKGKRRQLVSENEMHGNKYTPNNTAEFNQYDSFACLEIGAGKSARLM